MLQKLRDQTQSLFFKVLVGVIIVVLAIFGFGAFNLFVTSDPAIASANGEDITERMVMAEAERERRRLAARMGENFDPEMIDPLALQTMVINQLIARTLLGQAVDDLGLGASDTQVNASVTDNPNFQIDDRFDESTYRRVVQLMGYTPQEFLNTTRELLAIEQLRSGVVDTGFLTDWELRQNARVLNQRRDLAYLTFDRETFADQVEVDDAAVRLRYEENQLDYMTDESVDVAYVELTVDGLMQDPSIEVTEEDLIAAYEAEKAATPLSEQRDSRHILLQVNDERTVEAATARILEIREQILSGADFAEIAAEVSEDPGSVSAGGVLGPVGKGAFDPSFEAALWALAEGELSGPVETEFGVHLIRLDRIIPQVFPAFEEMQAQLETRLRREQAAELFLERVRELDNLAFEQPDSLQGLAESLDLEIRFAEGVTRDTGPGIFGNVQLRGAVFTDEVRKNGFNSPAVEYTEQRAVVARVTAEYAPEAIPFETVADQIRNDIVSELAQVAIDSAQTRALEQVKAGENVTAVAEEFGLQWRRVELARRNQPGVPPEVLQTAFNLPRPTEETKRVDGATGSAGTKYVVTVTRAVDGDLSTMTEAEIGSVQRFLAARVADLSFEGFYNTLEQEGSVRRPN
ncbi:MAG: SurA N-terminal domain-containing protein [Pseudomonadales bacterium]